MAPASREQTIVVAEDDARIADLLDLYLRDAGFRPLLAPTGERALELVRDHRPVLAVVDVGLPGIDGFEVCRRPRAGLRTGRRRLRGEAVLAAGGRGPDPRHPPAGRAARPHGDRRRPHAR